MKKISLLIITLLFTNTALAQSGINVSLQQKLHQMFKEDQKWRIESAKIYKHQHSDYDAETVNQNWERADSINMEEVKHIIKKYGYPGYSLVGESGSSWFWAIVQHCDNDPSFQQKVLGLMGKEVKRNNASGEDYALLTDRVLVNQNKKQLYGTQTRFNEKTGRFVPLPIQDSVRVDTRRKAVGLSSLKVYLKGLEQGN